MLFYGWIILIISFINVCGEGAIKNLFPVILLPLTETFGWSRAAASGVFSIAGLVNGFGSPAIGALLDKLGPRLFFPLGGILLFLGLMAAGHIHHYWQFVLIYVFLLASGENMISSYTNMAVLGRWFQKKRGRVIGISDIGTAVGAAIFVPWTQWLIIQTDWRHALQILAAVFLVLLIPTNMIFMRGSPEEKGQLPDGIENPQAPFNRGTRKENQPNDSTVPGDPQAVDFHRALTTSPLYFLTVARLFGSAAAYTINIHYIAFFVDAGYTAMTAASALAFTQIISAVGRPLGGAASDSIGREATIAISYMLNIIGIIVILIFGGESKIWPIVLFVFFRGLSMGPVGIAVGAKAADLYSGPILGKVMGVINMGRGGGLALGPFFCGLLYDMTQSYVIAFSLAVGFMVVSITFFWLAHLKGKILLQRSGLLGLSQ